MIENNVTGRRGFLILSASGVALVSCATNGVSCPSDQKLSKSACALEKQRNEWTLSRKVTLGVLVGASVGLGFALAFSGDPAVGAIIGASAGAITPIALSYYQSRLDQAHGSTTNANRLIVNDMGEDGHRTNTIIEAQESALDVMRRNLNDHGGVRSSNIEDAILSSEVAREADKQTRWARECAAGYKYLLNSTPLEKSIDAIEMNNYLQDKLLEAEENGKLMNKIDQLLL